MEEEQKQVYVTVDAQEVTEKAERLVLLLEKANSLADELALSLKKLQIDIKV